jgi:hypothetical protein
MIALTLLILALAVSLLPFARLLSVHSTANDMTVAEIGADAPRRCARGPPFT